MYFEEEIKCVISDTGKENSQNRFFDEFYDVLG